MTKFIFTYFLLVGFCFCAPAVFGQSSSFKKTCKRYFKASGSEETFKAALKSMTQYYRENESLAEVSIEVWDELEKEMLKEMDDLYDKLTEIYSKHFTEEELNKVIEFYESPIGKKMIKENPQIIQESMEAGKVWGEKIGKEIGTKLAKKGYRT
ncbi:MAG: DUF2059 domain-containing protein [Bacteroidia bacterium]